MNIYDFLKKESNNNTIKKKKIEFNNKYMEYKEFKKLGKSFFKETKPKIFTKDLDDKSYKLLKNKNLGNKIISSYEHIKYITSIDDLYLANFIYIITESAKDNSGYYKTIIDNLDNDDGSIFEKKHNINEIIQLVNIYSESHPKLKKINECVLYNNDKLQIEIYNNYEEDLAYFYHLFLLELAYYEWKYKSFNIIAKKCPVCNEIYYSKGERCSICSKKINAIRSNINQKCKRRRNKLKNYIDKYHLPIDIVNETNNLLNVYKNSFEDLSALNELISKIQNELSIK